MILRRQRYARLPFVQQWSGHRSTLRRSKTVSSDAPTNRERSSSTLPVCLPSQPAYQHLLPV